MFSSVRSCQPECLAKMKCLILAWCLAALSLSLSLSLSVSASGG